MLEKIVFDKKIALPIYLQIAESIVHQIENGDLGNGDILPSINLFNKQFGVARDTVEKAYKELKRRGYLESVKGSGYFIIDKKHDKIKILLVFNKISNFKKNIYYSFLETLGQTAIVDLAIHHYNPLLFNDIIEKGLDKYTYYVIMPHFEKGLKSKVYTDIIKRIPLKKLVLLDKFLPNVDCEKAVYQDFENDIYNALIEAENSLKNYSSVVLLFCPDSNHPSEIIVGVKNFCKKTDKSFKIFNNASEIGLKKGTLYITISDDDLVNLIKQQRRSVFKIQKNIGIISFNETQLKDILDISVISTDFEQMGKTAAELILTNQNALIKNPFRMIKRGSI